MAYEASGTDRYKETAGFIYSCISVVRDRNSLGARVLLDSQIELVASIVQRTCKWGKCDYLLHLLLAGVRAMDHVSVLNQMSAEKQELLKKALTVAVKHPKPDVKAAEAERKLSMEKARNSKTTWNLQSDEKQLNLCNRNAAECALLVAERWEIVTEELKDWAQLLEVPYDKSVWQEQKVIPKKKPEEPKKQKSDFPVIDDAYIERVRNKKGRGRPRKDKTVVVSPSNLVKVSPKEKREVHSDTITTEDGKELWSISKLEEKLGIKHFPAKKAYYIKNHPDARGIIERWFEKRGYALYFKSENFSKLQELMFPPKKEKTVKAKKTVMQDTVGLTPAKKDEKRRSDILKTVDGKELWSVQKLQKELKISNFSMVKSQYLKKHPGDRKMIEGWFEKRGTALYFDSTYFEKLKVLICPPKKANDDTKLAPQQPVVTPKTKDGVIQQTQDDQDENLLILFGALAQIMGYTNREVLRNKITTCLGRATEGEQDKVRSWFVKKGKSSFGWFRSGHVGELRAFLNSYDKRKRKKTEEPAPMADNVVTVVEPQPVVQELNITEIPNETQAPEAIVAPVVVAEEENAHKIEEKVVPSAPVASSPQVQKSPEADIPAFSMADVRAVVAYLERLMGLIELATKDYQTAETEYLKAKEEYERLDQRLGELNQTFGDIKDALVNVERAETHLANVLKQYLPQQNIGH